MQHVVKRAAHERNGGGVSSGFSRNVAECDGMNGSDSPFKSFFFPV